MVIGAGVVGLSIAWLLQHQGHRVTLVDPTGTGPQPPQAGSSAALGLLMARIYRRSSGRGWRLRQRSLELWTSWRQQLGAAGHPLPWRPGLLQLAADADAFAAQTRLAAERARRGLTLQPLAAETLAALSPCLPSGAVGGLFSPDDGQLDPLPAMAALRADAIERGLELVANGAGAIERQAGADRWRLALAGGGWLQTPWLVLSAGLGCPALLDPLGHHRPQVPVLGQALELQLPAGTPDPCQWPGSVSWGGVNLVPRPGGRLWLGATLEPPAGEPPLARASEAELASLRDLGGSAPEWLRQATVLRHWQGLRARPHGAPAPLLEELEPGLLLASGHYRNGVLLAPATAEWVAERIAAGSGLSGISGSP